MALKNNMHIPKQVGALKDHGISIKERVQMNVSLAKWALTDLRKARCLTSAMNSPSDLPNIREVYLFF